MGIEVRFADPANPESFANLSDDKTRAYFGETLPNPQLVPFPIAEVAEIGRTRAIPLIVDNTAAPLTCRPFDHGAAVVVHSLTKYIGGHGSSIGGIIIDGGNSDFRDTITRTKSLETVGLSYLGIGVSGGAEGARRGPSWGASPPTRAAHLGALGAFNDHSTPWAKP